MLKRVLILTCLASSVLMAKPYNPRSPLEFYQGPVFSNSRTLGMGGASVGLAEGSAAQITNPASLVNRYFYDEARWFDWDFLIEYMFDAGREVKMENNGLDNSPADSIDLVNLGAMLQFGTWGFGLFTSGLSYELCAQSAKLDCQDASKIVNYRGNSIHLGTAHSIQGGRFSFGTNLNLSVIQLGTGKKKSIKELSGLGLQLGFLWKEPKKNYRFGVSAKTPIKLKTQFGEKEASVLGVIPPEEAKVPWELALGFSYYWGQRNFNKKISFSESEQSLNKPNPSRRYYLLAVDLVLVGAHSNAVGVESWLLQKEQSAGSFLGLSPRVGLETEFWPGRMKGRVGSYWEPSRFHGVSGRLHGTLGFDLKLFKLWWWDLQLTSAIDVASQYQNIIISIFSLWH